MTGTIDATFSGSLSNTATVTAPPGTIDDPANNTATDDTTVVAEANLVVTKTDGTNTATPGTATTYTVTVGNTGPSAVTGAVFSDALPVGATAMEWTCSATAGSSCTASGSGAISDTVDLVPGGHLTYVVTVDVAAAATGTLTNVATATVPPTVTETTPLDNTATDVDTLVASTDLAITKTDGAPTAVPGTAISYTIVVTNNGPSDAIAATVTDAFPAELTGVGWTCTGPCTPSSSGPLNDVVDLPVGATATYVVSATVASDATGTLTNTAAVAAAVGTTDSVPANDSATDTDTLTPRSDLSITKTDSASTAVPGTPVTYTVVVANSGPSDVIGASVIDAIPANLTNAAWSCVAVGGSCQPAGTGDINTSVSLSVGGVATFTLTADVSATATGTVTNTATVSAPPSTTDPNPGNNTAVDIDTLTPQADLSVTKTDNDLTAQPGDTVTYQIVVANAGPSAVASAPFSDIAPAALIGVSWVCTASAGSSCPAAGAGNAINTTVSLLPGGSATFTVSATVAASAAGAIVNTASIDAPAGVVELAPGDNAATDTTSVTPTADLIVTKTDGLTSIAAGDNDTYTIVVTNAGPSTITDALVTDAVPPSLAGVTWTCNASPGSNCTTAGGSGNINALVTVVASGTATFTVTAQVRPSAPAGTLTNTATVSMPVGSIDPTPANNSATDTTEIELHADLAIVKTDGASSATPGLPVHYTVVVTNNGPSDALGATVTDALPAELIAATWTCAASAGSTCPGAGSGDVGALVGLLAGGTASFTVDATVVASALGTLVNTAVVAMPSGVADAVPGNNSATDSDTLDPVADLAVTKTDFSPTATPGATVTYTVAVSNAGPSDVVGATASDALPASLTGVTWTCSVSGSGSCPASGNGNINDAVSLSVGATATFGVTAVLSPSTTANLVNTATVSPPTGVADPTPGNNSATDVDTLARVADLSISKTDFAATATPGTSVSYQIVATNNGPSDISGALVADSPPADLGGVIWSCSSTGGASCANSSGAAAIAELVDLPVGGSVTFTLTGTLSAASTVPVTNTATITPPPAATDPDTANNSATDTDLLARVADLSITKTVDLATALPGDALTYSIVVSNAGPSDITDAAVNDVVPADLDGATWTCTPLVGGACGVAGPVGGDISTTVDLAVGGSVSFTLTGTVVPTATGTIVNTADVTAPAGAGDPNPANNTASASTAINPKADLSITKTDGNTTDIAGTSIQYSIVVTNNGPSTIQGVRVNDTVPPALSGVTWTCTASGFSSCAAATGSGDIATTVDLLSGTTATFVVDATIDPAFVGQLSNTATVTMPGAGVDPTPANNTATDTTTIVAEADLAVSKTDGTLVATPGETTVYTVTVTNAGPSAATGVTVSDVLPAGATAINWTCTASTGSTCTASGGGSIVDSISLLSGGQATYQVTVDVSSAATGTLVNTASVVPPSGVADNAPANNSTTDVDTLHPSSDLSVTKTDGLTSAVPGTTVTYTVVAANAGPSDAVGATVTDSLPTALISPTWTCVGTGGGTCTVAGAGNIADAITLPSGASATYTVTATIDPSATGSLVNTATVAPPDGTTDADPADNSSTDVDTLTPRADLSITKTDAAVDLVPGTPVTYIVVAANDGPSAVAGATVTDLLPAELLSATWTCIATGGSCPAGGSGDIVANIDLSVGGSATFTISATVSPAARSTLANTVTIAAPVTVADPVAGNNTATDTDTLSPVADLSITKTDGLSSAQPGDPVTYTIVVGNAGPSSVTGAPVTDVLPTGLAAASWTCVPSSGASCSASGIGNINTVVDLTVGATATFTVTTSITATTGVITNAARIDAPAGVSDPVPADNVATDTTSITPTADLSITKSDGLTTVAAGEVVTYTVIAGNAGPSPIIAATVADAVPAVLVGATWTCSATASSACGVPSGVGSINALVDLAPGGQATFSITGTVNPSAAPGLLSNTATVTMPAGSIDPTPGNNSATDVTTIERHADLAITKDDFTTTAVAGGATTYTVTVTNNGPSNVSGATVSDPQPTGATSMSWTCAASAAASCTPAGSGPISEVVSLAAGSSATFTVVVDIDAAASGLLTNTASVTPPVAVTDPNPANDSATDIDTVVAVADLAVSKDDGSPTTTPGTSSTYTIVVSNAGPSNVTAAGVVDSAPAGTTFTSWSCAAAPGASCAAATGSGNIATTVDLAGGSSATFTVTMAVDSATTADVTNTAVVAAPVGVSDPNPTNNTAGDTDAMLLVSDVTITKNDHSASVTPGGVVSYSIVASNVGPSDVIGATVADILPAAVTGATWSCVGAGGGQCASSGGAGSINELVNLPVGGAVTFTLSGTVDPSLTTDLVNTATIALPPGVTDPNLLDNVATDTDTTTPVTDLAVTKSDGLTSALPGDVVTYSIAVSNAGPSDAIGATLTDAVPASLIGVTWICTASNGSCAAASGIGSLNESIDVAVGATVTFSVTGTVAGSATGVITNTASVTAPTAANDPDPGNNSATDATTVNPKADLSITKTDGNVTDVAGTTVTYTIDVFNAGPSRISGVPVADVMPTALTGATWTCVPTAGSLCAGSVGTGDIATTVDLLAGGRATFTVTATIDAAFTGTLSNTATVSMPGVGVDPTPGNNTSTDITDIVAVADLSVTKSDGVVSQVPGTAVSYTVVVSNAGPSDVVGAAVVDVLPVSLSNVSWSCVGVGVGDVCASSGLGDVVDSVNLVSGGSVTYTVSGDLAAGVTGSLINSASVSAPSGVSDPDLANNSATDVDVLVPTADLSVTKSDGVVSQVPGTAVSYTVVVSNAGPSDVVGAAVVDVLPVSLSNVSWSCVGVGVGDVCASSGLGDVVDSVNLVSGGSVTYTVSGDLAAGVTGSLINSASVSAPSGVSDPDLANNSATDVDVLVPTADLSVTKSDGVVSQVPGKAVSYTVVVSNAGPSDIVGASVTDDFPSSLLGTSWTCVAVDGSCVASGSGSIATVVDLTVGGTATFVVNGTVSSSATGSITNTASVTPPSGAIDPNPANNSAADTDGLDAVADLAITKTDNDTNARPGDVQTYQIVATNTGPSAVTGAVVTDTVPAGLAGATWTCAAAGGGTCSSTGTGNLVELVDLPVGASVTFTVTATVTATAGTLTNTAQVDVPLGATDPNTANNAATDTTQVDPVGDLSITKTDGQVSAVPGAATTYTIDVVNSGPSAATGVTVIDVLPAVLTGGTWSCTATLGSACGTASGTGNIAELVDIAAGGTVSFAVTATIAPDATGTLGNTATLTVPAGFSDTNLANNSATDVTDLAPAVDLAVTKTDGQTVAVPGAPITYSIVVSNSGPSAAPGSRVVDSLPAALSSATWTCSATAGSSCGAASGSGSIDQIVSVGAAGTVVYIVTATVSPSAVGLLVNTVTVTPAAGTTDTNPANDSATDTDVLNPQVNLSIVKTDGAASAVPGTSITYSIVVANAGPSAVTAAPIADPLPAVLGNAGWTCAGASGGICGAPAGTGGLVTTATLPPRATVTYTLTADIAAGATGILANTATAAAPAGVIDTDPTDNSSTDIDSLTPSVDLSITKTDGVATVVPGTSTTYSITVTNNGPSSVVGADINDAMPAEIVAARWSCAAAGGATCGVSNGSGDVSMLASLPAGGSVTIVVIADIDAAAVGFVVNSATVAAPGGVVDTNAANDVATDSDALTPMVDLSITKDDGLVSALPGDSVSYAIVVTNNGPSAVVGATVTDAMPTGLTGVAWTCTPDPNSACAAPGGTGDIVTTVDLAAGESALFTVDAAIAANQLGTVTNTAAVAAPPGINDPNSANNIATDTTTVNGLGDVSITKTDGVSTIVAGTPTTYTIIVTNPGPSRIDGIQVVDALPAALVSGTWSCATTGLALCGSATGSGSINEIVDMPAGSTATFTVTATVASNASGTISNTAAVTLPIGVVDSDPTNNSATDLTDIAKVADLAVTKTDNVTSVIPGQSVSYGITVVNNGPSAVTAASLIDPLPAAIAGASWTCSPSSGAACSAASGTGSIVLDIDLAVGASAVVTVSGTVAATATGTLVNTATVTPPAGVTDPDGANNIATDSDLLNPVADVSVAKSNGVTSQSPAATSSYIITVANAGPSAAPGVTITDPLPSGVTTASWVCSAAAGSSCSAASGIGAVNTAVDLGAAGLVTLVVTLQAGASPGTLTNTVQATVGAGTTDPDPSNNVASDSDTLVFTADLAVTKVASTAVVAAGQTYNYTVVVTDNGPDPATGVTVLDTMPAGLTNTSWTCAATPGSTCPVTGTGDIATTIDLLAGGSATFTITTTTSTTAASPVVNIATATVGPSTVDPNPTNNTASASVGVDFTSALSVQKSASVASAAPGDSFSYNIVVSNAGPAVLDGVLISDPVPAGLAAVSWTCVGSAGGVCLLASGTGAPLLTADLPAGGSVTITLVVQVASDASGPILNVVTATAGSASSPVTAQATASVDVSPVVSVTGALSIAKSTTATSYSTVGATVTYSLVATNTGGITLTNVTITDPNATVAACVPVTLAPGESLTCSATHVVTQTDLDQGAVVNTAAVTGVSPTAALVTASSAAVVVLAARNPALSLTKSTSSADFTKAGEQVVYTISATNTGNVTLVNVTLSDSNAEVTGCAPTSLAPGRTLTCTAVHTVTSADVNAKVILNRAHATAQPGTSGGADISVDSNTVVLSRTAPLPTTGANVVSKMVLSMELLGFGCVLLVVGRRRRRPAR